MTNAGQRKNLAELIEGLECVHLGGPSPDSVEICDVATDSRIAERESLFVALSGGRLDGHSFVSRVFEQECRAVLVEKDKAGQLDAPPETCLLAVENTRDALGILASALNGWPQRHLQLVGLTGTNGKTTISYLLERILLDQGHRVGVIGTVDYRFTDHSGELHTYPAPFTTPEPLYIQQLLRRMVKAGVNVVIMEVSSHGLAQKRIGTLQFDVAAFTNLSHDHLDYHQTMEEYFSAKSLLFLHHLKPGGQGVVTFRSRMAEEEKWPQALAALLAAKDIRTTICGPVAGADIIAGSVRQEVSGTLLEITANKSLLKVSSPLVGHFNVDNLLTTLAVVRCLGGDLERAALSLAHAKGAPGRLEKVELIQPDSMSRTVFVDYAHTPDALENVLVSLKELPHDRLICVFGCGGDRDRTKRPEMGKIAASLSDIAIVTEDNPRTEPSGTILAQIEDGMIACPRRGVDWLEEGGKGSGYVVIKDRGSAIRAAVACSAEDDIVLVAGKGHEKYQLTNQGKRFFDDCLEVRKALFCWTSKNVACALGLTSWEGENKIFAGITTDTRALGKRQLFVALKGETFNAHDFLDKAVAAGAGGLVVENTDRLSADFSGPVFLVEDTEAALGDLAGYRRRRAGAESKPIVVGITGSCGKTTVKEMVASIFAAHWPDTPEAPGERVLKTRGNYNNLIGLPLSLLPLSLHHRAAIMEMGMNSPGEIGRLAEIAEPDISCIVNIHGAHLEGLGSIEGVASAKEELFTRTPERGILVINVDDPHIVAMAGRYTQRKVTFSGKTEGQAEVFARAVECDKYGMMSFQLCVGSLTSQVKLNVAGRHNVDCALAAAAIAFAAGVEVQTIAEGLEKFAPADKRMQVVRAVLPSCSIINDTYNANPGSMAAGLATLASIEADMRIAILGDMLELGTAGLEAHRDVGRLVAELKIDYLALFGDFAEYTQQGALEKGMVAEKVVIFKQKDPIVPWLEQLVGHSISAENIWILVKGSRGMKLETVVHQLTGSSID